MNVGKETLLGKFAVYHMFRYASNNFLYFHMLVFEIDLKIDSSQVGWTSVQLQYLPNDPGQVLSILYFSVIICKDDNFS